MKPYDFEYLLKTYGATHLICDGSQPLLSSSDFSEEALMYNLPTGPALQVLSTFNHVTDKAISAQSDISSLSGGQKVVLMILLALYSAAERIVLANIAVSLDIERIAAVKALIDKFKLSKREILILESL
jgi:ABC-type Mn2+/Zn2+ transport system ATPase subunit